jgi:tyrosyl-tRNA synthetase
LRERLAAINECFADNHTLTRPPRSVATGNGQEHPCRHYEPEEVVDYLCRDVAIVEPASGLQKKLKLDRPLVVKLGFDPTAPDLHLGHAVVLRKLREFQDLGHHVNIIIGDFTAAIGDPTGRNTARPPLSKEQIEKNAETYLQQLGTVLDLEKVQITRNSEWYSKMSFADTLRLLGQATLSQLLSRRDFSDRYERGLPVHMHEMVYPLMQGNDSVNISADIELGGTDQLFNNLVGRGLQENGGHEGQVVICMPILVGLDGSEKMSKSKNNHVGLQDAPEEMYGKLMSIPDACLPQYIELAMADDPAVKQELLREFTDGPRGRMELKMAMAYDVVRQYHGSNAAQQASDHFDRTIRNRAHLEKDYQVVNVSQIHGEVDMPLLYEAVASLRGCSRNEARKFITGGGARVNGQTEKDPFYQLEPRNQESVFLQLGKRQHFRIESP